jgi:hypothetical protein
MIGVVLMFASVALVIAGYWSHNAWKLEQYSQSGRHAHQPGSLDQMSARQIKARVEFQSRYNFTEADYL